MDLWDRFVRLPRPTENGHFSVETVDSRYRIARSSSDHPTVLLELGGESPSGAARRLPNILYRPPALLELTGLDGNRHQARLAVLECRTSDTALARYFLRIVETVLIHAVTEEGAEAFESALDAVITLFRSLEKTGTKSVQGLWTELAVVLWSKDPVVAIGAWHSSANALHDFFAGSSRMEVKSTLKDLREHSFLLDQLATFPDGATLILSIMLHETDNGLSVFELLDEVRARVAHDRGAISRLEAIVGESLVNSWRNGSSSKYDLASARKSLCVYSAAAVPSVPQPLPVEVKEVRFTADLTRAPVIALPLARTLAPLFEQMLPEGEKNPA